MTDLKVAMVMTKLKAALAMTRSEVAPATMLSSQVQVMIKSQLKMVMISSMALMETIKSTLALEGIQSMLELVNYTSFTSKMVVTMSKLVPDKTSSTSMEPRPMDHLPFPISTLPISSYSRMSAANGRHSMLERYPPSSTMT
jgi:hypothetical protein